MIRMWLIRLILVVLLFPLFSCQASDLSRTMKVVAWPLVITVEVGGYEYETVSGEEYTFVRGAITVENKGTAKETLELDALCLSSGDGASKGANVDSVAYFIPKIDIQPGQTVSKKVYWVFDSQIPFAQLQQAELLYKQNNCR